MLRTLAILSLSVVLSACGGVLTYEHNDRILVGPLDKRDLNELKSSGALLSKGSFDDMHHAIDRSGAYVGICRTKFHRAGAQAGDVDFHVYNVLRQESFSVGQKQLAAGIGDFAATPYEDLVARSPITYLHCYEAGASTRNSNLVLYLQLQGTEELAMNTAVEINVSGQRLDVVDVELFDRSSSPQRVIAVDNPDKGNSVSIDNGVIHINGSAVLLNGNPVNADSVKYRFN